MKKFSCRTGLAGSRPNISNHHIHFVKILLFLSLCLFMCSAPGITVAALAAPFEWPSSWELIYTDEPQSGCTPERDIREIYHNYDYDTGYYFLRMRCAGTVGWAPGGNWNGVRYKWFFDGDGNGTYQGGKALNYEITFVVEDTDSENPSDKGDGLGEIYLYIGGVLQLGPLDGSGTPGLAGAGETQGVKGEIGYRLVDNNYIDMYISYDLMPDIRRIFRYRPDILCHRQ